MKAFVFPGQGAQFPGMGKELYEQSSKAADLFQKANDILGFDITTTMFEGTEDELKQTNVTQPAVFLHSVITAMVKEDAFEPEMVAGHSLGEFSALCAAGVLSFEDGLRLVLNRALAMQKACEARPSTMAAVMGLGEQVVEDVCQATKGIVVPANFNSPGQIVISGTHESIDAACEKLIEAGAKRAIKLQVGGAFHSPVMEPARIELEEAIEKAVFNKPVCPVYQNVDAEAHQEPAEIKKNLIKQLTSPVKWTQLVENMIRDGASSFTEVGPGKVLQGLIKKIDRNTTVNAL